MITFYIAVLLSMMCLSGEMSLPHSAEHIWKMTHGRLKKKKKSHNRTAADEQNVFTGISHPVYIRGGL